MRQVNKSQCSNVTNCFWYWNKYEWILSYILVAFIALATKSTFAGEHINIFTPNDLLQNFTLQLGTELCFFFVQMEIRYIFTELFPGASPRCSDLRWDESDHGSTNTRVGRNLLQYWRKISASDFNFILQGPIVAIINACPYHQFY